MTDIKKLAQISDDAIPEFPTSRRSGYVEDSVDKWLTEHYDELRQIIDYQNYCVEVAETAEAERDEAQGKLSAAESKAAEAEARATAAEARAEAAEAVAAEAADIASQWETAYNDLAQREPAAPVVAPVADTVEREAAEVSTLLQNATKLARDHIEQAKVDADKIREDAETELQELRREIERLGGERYAAFHTLSTFYTKELSKLAENPVFADLKDVLAVEVVGTLEDVVETLEENNDEADVDLAVQESVALEEAEENDYELETTVEDEAAPAEEEPEEALHDDSLYPDDDEDEVVVTVADDEDEKTQQ